MNNIKLNSNYTIQHNNGHKSIQKFNYPIAFSSGSISNIAEELVKPKYLDNAEKQIKKFGNNILNKVKEIGQPIIKPITNYIYKDADKGGTIQFVVGSSAFAAIWSNMILGSMNMILRPASMILGNDDKVNKVTNNKTLPVAKTAEENKKYQAKLYTAGRMFMQEAFGLIATASFIILPVKEWIGLHCSKLMANITKDADVKKALKGFTAKSLKAFEADSEKTLQKYSKENINLIKGARGLGDAIAIILALSVMGPTLNNFLVNPMLRLAKKPLQKLGIEVDVPPAEKKHSETILLLVFCP